MCFYKGWREIFNGLSNLLGGKITKQLLGVMRGQHVIEWDEGMKVHVYSTGFSN